MKNIQSVSKKVKMSCQNVWKVYGDNPDHFFSNDSHTEKDPSALSKELSDHGHIVANADVILMGEKLDGLPYALKLAKKIKGEIINADSMQVYKELKILSARPSKKDYKKIKHHLYGFQSVKKNYSSGEWLKAAKKKILDIKKRNNVPIIVGGTGLYFKTLTDGIVNIPKIPIQIREKVRKLNSSMGNKIFLKNAEKFYRI